MNPIQRMDMWLIIRIFMRFSHWVDWRFHRNQYDLAAWVLTGSLAMNAAANLQAVINNWRYGMLNLFSSGALIWAYTNYLPHLKKASADYERRPGEIPREAIYFILMPYWMRTFTLFVGLWFWATMITMASFIHRTSFIVDAITGWWMPGLACAWYIAAGLPPARDRRKKASAAPDGAALARVAN